jgi:hypothetical protein
MKEENFMNIIDPARSLQLLSRWALFAVIITLLHMVVHVFMMFQLPKGFVPSFFNLEQTVPILFRITYLLFAFSFIALCGTLVVSGAVLAGRAPVKSAILAICGLAQLFGAAGYFIRVIVMPLQGSRHVEAAPVVQQAIFEDASVIGEVTTALTTMGMFFHGIAFLLLAWGTWLLPRFPRWLSIWFVLPGLTGLLLFASSIIGVPNVMPLFLLHFIFGLIGVQFGIAFGLRRPKPDMISAISIN